MIKQLQPIANFHNRMSEYLGSFWYAGNAQLTERIMAHHKALPLDKHCFDSLLLILDLFIKSGWQEALKVTWRQKDAF
jgi:hypothetical protein